MPPNPRLDTTLPPGEPVTAYVCYEDDDGYPCLRTEIWQRHNQALVVDTCGRWHEKVPDFWTTPEKAIAYLRSEHAWFEQFETAEQLYNIGPPLRIRNLDHAEAILNYHRRLLALIDAGEIRRAT